MKTAVVYVSIHHGNTEKIAKEIASVLDARLLEAEEADPKSLSEFDLLGFGSGIYYGKHHEKLLRLVHTLPTVERKKAFVFSTAGVSDRLVEKNLCKNHQALRGALTDKGLDIVGDFSCCGFMTWAYYRFLGGRNKDRPNRDDLERARAFAENLKRKIQTLPGKFN